MQLRGAGITVFCGSSPGADPRFLAQARALGAALACDGAVVVYGGASVGLMGAVADAALAAGGRVTGVIPRPLVERELAHRGLTQLHVVETMHERKALMSRQAHGYVVLPGGFGTWEEMLEVVTWKQMGLHKKPVVLVNVGGYYASLLAQVQTAVTDGFMRPHFLTYITVVESAEAAVAALRAFAEPGEDIGKWA
ncbi:MAG: TIGR00730 family Rossman fold protein [Deltaproteobacteria bacterium]|nr:TIGR00730 family Rossman fold protein [Deltaproteobacteria bacterium]